MTHHVFVGYDIREHAAWLVCKDTIENPFDIGFVTGSMLDVKVHPLSHRDLRRRKLFDRPWRIDAAGQTWDERDGRPFSTEFAHSRFLVPKLAQDMGITTGLVMFVDCDFMFLRPVTEMLKEIDTTKVVSVIKHDVAQVAEGTKMDGMSQKRYFRKLWSSLMVFNMDHDDISLFTHSHGPNHSSGSSLHGLTPLADEEIGEIDRAWNHIPGQCPEVQSAKAVHWSLGGPWMPGYEEVAYAEPWRQRYRDVMVSALSQNLAATFPLV
jgi:hypothetical protein